MTYEKTDDDPLKAKLEWINKLELCNSVTKTLNVDATLKQRAKLTESVIRGHLATKLGCAAFTRLLGMAETRDSGQIRWIALFLHSIWNSTPDNRYSFQNLRGLDMEIGDDMLAVIDAIRWGEIPVDSMADNLKQRMPKMLCAWGLIKPTTEEN